MTLRVRPAEMGSHGDWRYLRAKRRPPAAGGPVTRIVDLFSGCGGMTLGVTEAARALGFASEIVLAMEKSDPIRQIYDSNFKTRIRSFRSDVCDRFDGNVGASLTPVEVRTAREVGAIDLLLGGPPCQGHSTLNNHTRTRDPKNSLYLRMIRAVEVLTPSAVLIENVPNVRNDHSGVVHQATQRLADLGYKSLELVLSADRLGVPQLRTRHVLAAVRDGDPLSLDALLPHEIDEPRSVRWAIDDLVHEAPSGIFTTPSVMSRENVARIRYLQKHRQYDLPNRLRPPCHRDKPHKYKSMYGRLSWDEPAQTITTGFGSPGQGRYVHPVRPRTLTPHEAARLQFFPDWYDFSVATKRIVLAECIGNAVPPKLAFCLGHVLMSALRRAGRNTLLAG